MTTAAGTSSVRERILATASDLFYRQGYRATGINQVIAESGVAKASFYDHFPSKHDLLHAYVEATARREMEETRAHLASLPNATERFYGLMRSLTPWFEVSDFRGCPFQNVVVEIEPEEEEVRRVARQHHMNIRGVIRELVDGLMEERTELRDRIDPEELTDTYLLLLEGAIALGAAYRSPWPVEAAVRSLEAHLHLT